MATWQEHKVAMDVPSNLWSAAKANDVAELRRLLAGGAKLDERDHHGYTALMLASYSGNQAALDFLLEAGADPNSADLAGNSVLMGAAFKGNESFVIKLLAAGANPVARNHAGLDAMAFAAQFGRTAIAELFSALTLPRRSVA